MTILGEVGLLDGDQTRDGGRLGTDAVAATLAALPDGARAADAVAAYDRLLETVEPVDDVAIIVVAAVQ